MNPTPGPWHAMVCEGDITVRTSGSQFILAQVRQPGKVLTGDHSEQIANATLMAAAPLLLNALVSLLANYYDTKDGPSVVPYFCAGKDDEIKDRWNVAMRAVKAAGERASTARKVRQDAAIEDAAALGRHVGSTLSVEAGLEAYDAERRPVTTKLVRTSRRIGQLGQIEGPALGGVRDGFLTAVGAVSSLGRRP